MASFPAESGLLQVPVATSGMKTKSVLVSVLGPGLIPTDADGRKMARVSSHYDQTQSVGHKKSRLVAIFGPDFKQSMANGDCGHAFSMNVCESVGGCEICRLLKAETPSTDEMLEVEDISRLELQFKEIEALFIGEPETVTQHLGKLQKRMRVLSKTRVSRPVELPAIEVTEYRTPCQDLSPIEQKLQDLTERIGLNDNVVTQEEFRSMLKSVENALRSIHDALDCNRNFQKQLHQRIVPRIILCTKRKRARQKLIHKLTPGVKSVRLHMLCEQAGEEHKVEGAPGCDLHLKTGETWDAIYPFLHHGLMVFEAVSNIATRILGAGDNLLPSGYSWIKEFNEKVQPAENVNFHRAKATQTAAGAANQGAEQWLVNHLTGIDKMKDFGLQTMTFDKTGSQPEGSIIWLCKEHADNGKDSKFLSHLPTASN